jgi:nicotinamide riboside transporter PnuC
MDMLELIGKYYGTDWLAMSMAFLFIYYVGEKKRHGFIFGILVSIFWLIFAFLAQSVANVIANVAFVFLNIRGYVYWGKEGSPN